MAVTSWRTGGTVVGNVTAGGQPSSILWSGTGNIAASDNSYATAALALGEYTYWLRAYNFGFNAEIPAAATIDGIEVEFEAKASASSAIVSAGCLCVDTADVQSDSLQLTPGGHLTTSDAFYTFGGAADTLNAENSSSDPITDVEVRDGPFGVMFFAAAAAAATVSVDRIRMRVYYTVNSISASAAITEANDTCAGIGTLKMVGTASITEANDTAAGTATLKMQATAAITEANDTAAGTATLKLTGSAAITESDDTLSASGQHFITVGTSTMTEEDDVAAGTATLKMTATGAITEGNDTASGTATIRISATGAIVEGDDVAAGSGALTNRGTAALAEEGDTVSASGELAIITITPAGRIALVDGSTLAGRTATVVSSTVADRTALVT